MPKWAAMRRSVAMDVVTHAVRYDAQRQKIIFSGIIRYGIDPDKLTSAEVDGEIGEIAMRITREAIGSGAQPIDQALTQIMFQHHIIATIMQEVGRRIDEQ